MTNTNISFTRRISQDEELDKAFWDYENEQRERRITALRAIFGQVEGLSVPCLYVPWSERMREKYGEKIPATLILDEGKPAVEIDDELVPDAPFFPLELDFADDSIIVNGTEIDAGILLDIFTI